MALSKSASIASAAVGALALGSIAGWALRGPQDVEPFEASRFGAATASSTMLLPRAAAATSVPTSGPTSVPTTQLTPAADAPDTAAADESETPSESDPAPETAVAPDEQPAVASTTAVGSASATEPTAPPPTLAPTTTTTTEPATTTTLLILTDPTIAEVQFQSPVACVATQATATIQWVTVDAASVAIEVDGIAVASGLNPSGQLAVNFACTDGGLHEVVLTATGISSDPNRPAFTSSITDTIQTDG